MSPRHNALLADLPESEYERLMGCMELVSLPKGQTLFGMGETPAHIYFPVGAIVSMMIDMADGYSIEIHMLGRSCMVGVAAINEPSFYRATVRDSGLAYRMQLHDLNRLRAQCPHYMGAALQAVRRLLMHLSLGVACGKHHSVEQQLTRWLLLTLDRTAMPTVTITHQELSEILGFRREAITLTFARLAELGCIKTGRGELEVLDRHRLEAFSCDCYWTGQEKIRPVGQSKLGLF